MSRRVVVTGMGAITPIGNSIESFWKGITEGELGIGEITYFDTTELEVKQTEMYIEGFKANLEKDTSRKGLWKVSFELKEF